VTKYQFPRRSLIGLQVRYEKTSLVVRQQFRQRLTVSLYMSRRRRARRRQNNVHSSLSVTRVLLAQSVPTASSVQANKAWMTKRSAVRPHSPGGLLWLLLRLHRLDKALI